jgi:hypothetical protein
MRLKVTPSRGYRPVTFHGIGNHVFFYFSRVTDPPGVLSKTVNSSVDRFTPLVGAGALWALPPARVTVGNYVNFMAYRDLPLRFELAIVLIVL